MESPDVEPAGPEAAEGIIQEQSQGSDSNQAGSQLKFKSEEETFRWPSVPYKRFDPRDIDPALVIDLISDDEQEQDPSTGMGNHEPTKSPSVGVPEEDMLDLFGPEPTNSPSVGIPEEDMTDLFGPEIPEEDMLDLSGPEIPEEDMLDLSGPEIPEEDMLDLFGPEPEPLDLTSSLPPATDNKLSGSNTLPCATMPREASAESEFISEPRSVADEANVPPQDIFLSNAPDQGPMVHEDAPPEDELFVTQPGDILRGSVDIDLTEETVEDTSATGRRIAEPAREESPLTQVKEEGEEEQTSSIVPIPKKKSKKKKKKRKNRDAQDNGATNHEVTDSAARPADQPSHSDEGERPWKRQCLLHNENDSDPSSHEHAELPNHQLPEEQLPGIDSESTTNTMSHEDSWGLMETLLRDMHDILGGRSEEQLSPGERIQFLNLKTQIGSMERRLRSSESVQGGSQADHGHEQPSNSATESLETSSGTTSSDPAPKFTGRVKDAQDYWRRKYHEANIRDFDAKLLIKLKRVPQKAPATDKNPNWWENKGNGASSTQNPREKALLQLLREGDPITARAALGNITLPGAIESRNKHEQLKQIMMNISSNPDKQGIAYEKKVLKEATVSFGHGKCKAEHGRWKVPGLKTPLYNHQLVGVRWMLGQEFSPEGPYGGILADQMGLGKTVQILGVMSNNLPSQELVRAGKGATLIVTPASTIAQWMGEITRHSPFEKVIHYQSSKMFASQGLWDDCEIVITSYQEVAKAHPSEEKLKRIASMKLNDEDWAEEFDKELGWLMQRQFYRVILDEAHAIKNQHSRTSKACISLNAKHRWALSGTPIQNSIDELYPYMRFIGADWAAADFETFKQNFGNIQDDTVQQRLAAFVPSIMLRRRVQDTFLGRPLLEIPRTHPIDFVTVDLSIEERLMYRRLESRFRDNLSQHIKDGTAKQKTRTYLAYLTRLRQVVAHPFLLEAPMTKDFTLEDMAWLRSQLKLLGGKTPLFKQIQTWVKMDFEDHPKDQPTTFGKSAFGYDFNMDRQLDAMYNLKSLEEVICRLCYDTPENPQITECGHTFCYDCLASLLGIAKERGKNECKCPACGATVSGGKALAEPVKEPSERPESEAGGSKKKEKHSEPGDDEFNSQPKGFPFSTWLAECDKTPDEPVTPGVKATAVKNKILQWQREAPDDKIIIFTQWVLLARILGRIFAKEEIKFLYFFGHMTAAQKNAVVNAFHEKPEIKILIASTKCGGQALNLTCANRVISTDLWWNTAMERQAFGRVHRIGQLKETHFCKIIAKNTIDERLVDMQEEKDEFISRTLNDDLTVARKNITFDQIKSILQISGHANESDSEDDDQSVVDVEAPPPAAEDVEAPPPAAEDVEAPPPAAEDAEAPPPAAEDVEAPLPAAEDVEETVNENNESGPSVEGS